MKLPNAARADLGTKIEEYLLHPRHREGQHKAGDFASVLASTLDNAALLRSAVFQAAATSDPISHQSSDSIDAPRGIEIALSS